jgi:hypothetical protein
MSEIVYDEQRDKILVECKAKFNDICLSFNNIYRLVGFKEGEDDYYYICDDIYGKRSYVSCCCFMESLKGKIDQYDALEKVFTLNGGYAEKEFILSSEVYELLAGFYNVYLDGE